jgi:hypothetical protein
MDDLGVEGAAIALGPFGEVCVQVGGQTEGDALFFIHDFTVVARRLFKSGKLTL